MSLNPLRALGSASCGSASCHRIFKDLDEMERHQSHEMRGVTWLCEISLTPAWPQYAGIPHPTRPPGEETHAPARSSGPPIPWTVGGILPWGEVSPLGEGTFAPSPVYFQYDGKGREEGQTPLRISEF